MARLIRTDATEEALTPMNGKTFSLEELQTAVGGWIETIRFENGTILVCNEEGKIKNLPHNVFATQEWERHFGPTDVIVGNALICAETEIE